MVKKAEREVAPLRKTMGPVIHAQRTVANRRNNMFDKNSRSTGKQSNSGNNSGRPSILGTRPVKMINKYQLVLAEYIKKNKDDVTLSGTKRFSDKSGEYYLKNVLFKNNGQSVMKGMDLNNPQDIYTCLENCNGKTDRLKKRADRIVAQLPTGSLTPIPVIKDESKKTYGEKNSLVQAKRTAVTIRRIEYATAIKAKGAM
ncbi:MAG: hypothetical protein MJ252_13330, partial [archaeon]|nr:hypothetical protein [archaeon]